jgi:hypothetical protein
MIMDRRDELNFKLTQKDLTELVPQIDCPENKNKYACYIETNKKQDNYELQIIQYLKEMEQRLNQHLSPLSNRIFGFKQNTNISAKPNHSVGIEYGRFVKEEANPPRVTVKERANPPRVTNMKAEDIGIGCHYKENQPKIQHFKNKMEQLPGSMNISNLMNETEIEKSFCITNSMTQLEEKIIKPVSNPVQEELCDLRQSNSYIMNKEESKLKMYTECNTKVCGDYEVTLTLTASQNDNEIEAENKNYKASLVRVESLGIKELEKVSEEGRTVLRNDWIKLR